MQYSIPKYADDLKFKVVMMTVERAEQLLANNHPLNRSIKKGKVAQMVADQEEGNWKLTPEPIVVSDKGRLLDGQNRCTSVTISRIAVPMVLCTGLPEPIIVAMDCGASRNVADAAKILDKDIKNVVGIASVARRMSAAFAGKAEMSIQETLAWIDGHKNALAFAWQCLPLNKAGLTQASVRAVIARAYYRRPVEETRIRCLEFGEVLISGLPKSPRQDSAAIRLRNWLQDHFQRGTRIKGKGVRVSATVVYAKTETALMHFLNREPVDSLKETSNELFWIPGESRDAREAGPQLAEETA